jgi:hypothetical protein
MVGFIKILYKDLKQNTRKKPSWAHGIEAEIPEDLRSKAEELERIARFFALCAKNAL